MLCAMGRSPATWKLIFISAPPMHRARVPSEDPDQVVRGGAHAGAGGRTARRHDAHALLHRAWRPEPAAAYDGPDRRDTRRQHGRSARGADLARGAPRAAAGSLPWITDSGSSRVAPGALSRAARRDSRRLWG